MIELPWRWKTVMLLENREGNNRWHKPEKMFFSYTEHLICISNINMKYVYIIYLYIHIVCVYMCLLHMESTRDLGYHYFGTYPDIPSNLWNQKMLLSSSRFFFSTYISSRWWCSDAVDPMQALLEDAQGILSLILHLTISGWEKSIQQPKHVRYVRSPWMFFETRGPF